MLRFQHDIGPDELRVRTMAREIVHEHIAPFAIEDDKQCRFRPEVYQALGKKGLTAISSPVAFGGLGLPYACYYAAIEEIAKATPSYAITLGVTNLIQGALISFGNDDQKKKYLTRLTSGEWVAAFSLSEPNSGTDAASLQCQAVKKGNSYFLTGTKMWCSSAGSAGLYMVMARTGEHKHKHKGITAFLVEANQKGFSVGKQEKKLGLNASPLAELSFENCEVPLANRLGEEGEGLKVALSQLDAGRISIGAVGMGIAEAALTKSLSFGLGSDLLELLSDHYAELQALKVLIREASSLRDRKAPLTFLASVIKLKASDLAVRTASDIISILGPEGVRQENEFERMLRDAKALQIVEGTNQIQRMLIAKHLGEN